MDKNDVLLTEEEFTKAYESVTNRIQGISTRMQAGREAQNKAQCLKLLKLLNQPCDIVQHHIKTYDFHLRKPRRECLVCISEIEKLLKEQND